MNCKDKQNIGDCELQILRSAVDNIEKKIGANLINNPEIIKIISIVEDFLKSKKLVCYGGTAINNILPPEDQFYNKNIELPDYDFFSPTPMNHAKQLADLYYKMGFTEVEAKSGVHAGTFKVFVNFLPVADITYLVPELFKRIKKDAVQINNILYSPPNFLRMLMYLELSRPQGNVSRWEKVLKRLILLNKNYPLVGKNCNSEVIQRIFDMGTRHMSLLSDSLKKEKLLKNNKNESKKSLKEIQEDIFDCVFESLVNQGCIFFGAFANRLFYKLIKRTKKSRETALKKIPDFDVLATEPMTCATILKEKLKSDGYKKIKIIKKPGVGETIAEHVEFKIGDETLLFIYKPLACHSYNVLSMNNKKIRIATIDTMLSFYLAFLYVNRPYYRENRILCMCEYLFKAQQKYRLRQRGLLKRFSIDCYGKQQTKESMRAEKNEMYTKLKDKRRSKEFQWWFLRYITHEKHNNKISLKQKKKSGRKTFKRVVKKGKRKKKRQTKKMPKKRSKK